MKLNKQRLVAAALAVAIGAVLTVTGASADEESASDPNDAQTSESDIVRVAHSHDDHLLLHTVEVAGDLEEGFDKNLSFDLHFDINRDGDADRTVFLYRAEGRVVAEIYGGSQSLGFVDLRFVDASTFQVAVADYQLKPVDDARGVRSYDWYVTSHQAYAVPFPCYTEEPTPAPSPSPMCHGDVFSDDRAPDEGAMTHELEGVRLYANSSRSEVSLTYRDGVFEGTVTGVGRCRDAREVRVFRVRGGPDRYVGNDATEDDGSWSLYVPQPREGKYIARVARQVGPGRDANRFQICTGADSNVWGVP